MCNLYQSTPRDRINMRFALQVPDQAYLPTIAPLRDGPFVLADRVVVGQWGMIPPKSRTKRPTLPNGKPMSTNNARVERIATAPTYRDAWARGQRCLIPADSYDEPYWGTGKNIWWRFRRADGHPWALAGLWSEWLDHATGELVPSYTMITQNCDQHGLLRRMHKPDPKLGPDQQDKRAVVPIEHEHWDQWLNGSMADAQGRIKLPDTELFEHGPADPTNQATLPL
jgi:putative SOS response-associated peptidase YedK